MVFYLFTHQSDLTTAITLCHWMDREVAGLEDFQSFSDILLEVFQDRVYFFYRFELEERNTSDLFSVPGEQNQSIVDILPTLKCGDSTLE